MKPEIKAILERDLLRAYNEAENDVEKDNLYWIAWDLGIKLPRPADESVKQIIDGIHKIFEPFKNFGK